MTAHTQALSIIKKRSKMKIITILITLCLFLGCENQSTFKKIEVLEYSNLEVNPQKINSGKWGKYRAEVIYENKSYISKTETNEFELNFDFYRPNGINNKLPMIVFIHSGAFIAGNKNNFIINSPLRN